MERIELREYQIEVLGLHIGTHQYWVLYNAEGNIVEELHGLATDKTSKQPVYIGTYLDELKVWRFSSDSANTKFSISPTSNGFSGFYKPGQPFKIMATQSESIALAWEAACRAARVLNSSNLGYRLLSGEYNNLKVGNSNSIARTLGDIMDLRTENISGRFAPGRNKNLLPKEVFPHLYIKTL